MNKKINESNKVRMLFTLSPEIVAKLREMSERTLISMSKLVELGIKELKR